MPIQRSQSGFNFDLTQLNKSTGSPEAFSDVYRGNVATTNNTIPSSLVSTTQQTGTPFAAFNSQQTLATAITDEAGTSPEVATQILSSLQDLATAVNDSPKLSEQQKGDLLDQIGQVAQDVAASVTPSASGSSTEPSTGVGTTEPSVEPGATSGTSPEVATQILSSLQDFATAVNDSPTLSEQQKGDLLDEIGQVAQDVAASVETPGSGGTTPSTGVSNSPYQPVLQQVQGLADSVNALPEGSVKTNALNDIAQLVKDLDIQPAGTDVPSNIGNAVAESTPTGTDTPPSGVSLTPTESTLPDGYPSGASLTPTGTDTPPSGVSLTPTDTNGVEPTSLTTSPGGLPSSLDSGSAVSPTDSLQALTQLSNQPGVAGTSLGDEIQALVGNVTNAFTSSNTVTGVPGSPSGVAGSVPGNVGTGTTGSPGIGLPKDSSLALVSDLSAYENKATSLDTKVALNDAESSELTSYIKANTDSSGRLPNGANAQQALSSVNEIKGLNDSISKIQGISPTQQSNIADYVNAANQQIASALEDNPNTQISGAVDGLKSAIDFAKTGDFIPSTTPVSFPNDGHTYQTRPDGTTVVDGKPIGPNGIANSTPSDVAIPAPNTFTPSKRPDGSYTFVDVTYDKNGNIIDGPLTPHKSEPLTKEEQASVNGLVPEVLKGLTSLGRQGDNVAIPANYTPSTRPDGSYTFVDVTYDKNGNIVDGPLTPRQSKPLTPQEEASINALVPDVLKGVTSLSAKANT